MEHVVFVAHMDEVGFQVVSIAVDGRLLVQPRGGLYASLWEVAGPGWCTRHERLCQPCSSRDTTGTRQHSARHPDR